MLCKYSRCNNESDAALNAVDERSKTSTVLRSLLLGFVLPGVLSCWGTTASSPPNMILVVIDTLRADHLGCYGYGRDTTPILDAFAQENLKYALSVSTAPWTSPAVASIFTGLYPTAHGLRAHEWPQEKGSPISQAAVLSDELETLAELLQSRGYQTAAVIANAWLTDYLGFSQGFDTFDAATGALATTINQKAFGILDAFAADPAPFFLYLHYLDPHGPYRAPSISRQFDGALANRPYYVNVQKLLNSYDSEIYYVDSQIGHLFDELHARGLYEDAVILVTADHGEQFFERGKMGHGHHLFREETHVPLLLKAGGRRGEIKRAVSGIDIYPTLLELAGATTPEGNQAVSLLSSADERPGVISEATRGRNHKAFIRRDGVKLILSYQAAPQDVVTRRREAAMVGLFDFWEDPFEESEVKDVTLEANLRAAFYAVYARSIELQENREDEIVPLRDVTIEQLRELGYVN